MKKLLAIGTCLLTTAALAAATAQAQIGAADAPGAGSGAGSAAAGGGTSPGAGAGAGAGVAGGQDTAAGTGTTAGAAGSTAQGTLQGQAQGTLQGQAQGTIGTQGTTGANAGTLPSAAAQSQLRVGAPQGAVVQPGGSLPQRGVAVPQGQFQPQGEIGVQAQGQIGERSFLQGQPGAAQGAAGAPGALGVWLLGTPGPGVEISRITAGSAAEAAGLMPGDVLLSINGQPVASPLEVQQLIRSIPAGQTAQLEVGRAGATQQIAATLMPSQQPYEAAFRGDVPIAEGDLAARTARLEQQLGMVVEELRMMRQEMAQLRSGGQTTGAATTGAPPAGTLDQPPAEPAFDDFDAPATQTTAPPANIPPAPTAPATPAEEPADDDLFGGAATETDTATETTPPAEADTEAPADAADTDAAETEEADPANDPLFQ